MTDMVAAPLKRKLFEKEEVNTSRQIQFDIAKVVCLVGMVFVHCFEELSVNDISDGSVAQFIFVVVLDCLFGAGTFMACMGLGIAYSWKGGTSQLIKRGLLIFGTAYVLNILRFVLPFAVLAFLGHDLWSEVVVEIFFLDILQFAGLALVLFALLKRFKLSDLWMFVIALAMSIAGSFVFRWDAGSLLANDLLGLFVGTKSADNDELMAYFPLLNWFVIVIFGYLYGKGIRRCTNLNKFYAIALPISLVILSVYMGIAIPNKIGMMSGDLDYFYQMDTISAFVVMSGAIVATGLYHFISKAIPELGKRILMRLSGNINSFYCIHWVMIGWIESVLMYLSIDGLEDSQILIVAIVVLIVAGTVADVFRHKIRKNKHKAIAVEENKALQNQETKALVAEESNQLHLEKQNDLLVVEKK